MAWIFSMWVDTGTEAEGKTIKNHFNGQIILANNKEYVINASQAGMITVDGISRFGITSKSDEVEMRAIGFEFYKLLKVAPSVFRFAIVGVEVDGWRTIEELEEDPSDLLNAGIVIRKDIYYKLGSPGELVEFNVDYLWTPYVGEKWKGKKI